MSNSDNSQYVKKETMLIVALVAAVAGFLGGIVYSVYSSGSDQARQATGPAQQATQQGGISAQQASSILALEKEVAANPDNSDAWTRLGHVYFDTDNFPKAINAYEKSLSLSPNNPNVLTDLGVMYRRNGQPEIALETFDKAIQIDPKHEQSRFNKGVVLNFDLKDREGAMNVWNELLKVNPSASLPDGRLLKDVIDTL